MAAHPVQALPFVCGALLSERWSLGVHTCLFKIEAQRTIPAGTY